MKLTSESKFLIVIKLATNVTSDYFCSQFTFMHSAPVWCAVHYGHSSARSIPTISIHVGYLCLLCCIDVLCSDGYDK